MDIYIVLFIVWNVLYYYIKKNEGLKSLWHLMLYHFTKIKEFYIIYIYIVLFIV